MKPLAIISEDIAQSNI